MKLYFLFLFFFQTNFCLPQYGPITDHFKNWLQQNGYGSYDFARLDMGTSGSFGGFNNSQNSNNSSKIPIVFIHGNSDAALTFNDFSTGWTSTVEYFLEHGYSISQLYATSWGDTNTTLAVLRDHDCKTVIRLRKFVEAVLEYSGSKKIDLISHSMGVTLARKIMQGGSINASDGICNIGFPLFKKIRTILGIAGANFGLCSCISHGTNENTWPTCNNYNGLWPGESCNGNCSDYPLSSPCNALNYSQFLMDLNHGTKVAENIFSMWSIGDTLIGNNNMVWGRSTSEIPYSDGKLIYTNYSHMEVKEKTAADQYAIITNLGIP